MLATVQLPAHACGNTFSGEPDAGKSACPVRRGDSGSHRKVSPSLLLYRLCGEVVFLFGFGFAGLRSASPIHGLHALQCSAWTPKCIVGAYRAN